MTWLPAYLEKVKLNLQKRFSALKVLETLLVMEDKSASLTSSLREIIVKCLTNREQDIFLVVFKGV